MTIHEVTFNDEDRVVSAKHINQGYYVVEHAGLRVPIYVDQYDHVTIFVDGIEGNIWDLNISGFGDEQNWDLGDEKRSLSEIKISPEEGESVFSLFGRKENSDEFVSIVRAGKMIEVGMRRREIE